MRLDGCSNDGAILDIRVSVADCICLSVMPFASATSDRHLVKQLSLVVALSMADAAGSLSANFCLRSRRAQRCDTPAHCLLLSTLHFVYKVDSRSLCIAQVHNSISRALISPERSKHRCAFNDYDGSQVIVDTAKHLMPKLQQLVSDVFADQQCTGALRTCFEVSISTYRQVYPKCGLLCS